MIELLKLLPKSLTTFLYAVAALLRFYGNSDTILFSFFPFTTIEWSFLVFVLGSGSLVVNLGLEWHAGNQSRREAAAARTRIEDENLTAREREARRDALANEAREREARRDALANEERERATRHTRIQNRWIILQIQHQLESSPNTRAALRDFLVFLSEYGE
ncbi:MAG: hypothetical protein KA717_11505 [Woronichinia naegeliana WA131]|jgi:hypothetical protein|uniref:Uncharacterized protein n=1 Tax=Woronichinia naegeliana WA131 TaxID=2824559 RepID=A0A977PYE4_9CYAN|nr:MAG: hypothetical protein KA717_11505 [Woronichinia naegeliana WA131]